MNFVNMQAADICQLIKRVMGSQDCAVGCGWVF